MNMAGYRFNLDALLARIIYRWRGRVIVGALLLSVLVALYSEIIPPFWRGRVVLRILAAPGATVQLDGRVAPRPLYAGRHAIVATLPDGRSAWMTIDLRAGQALTLTLPTGLHEPHERALPPAAPGAHIDQVWWADGAWRVTSIPNAPAEPVEQQRQPSAPTPVPQPGQTVAVSAHGMERLSTIDAYAGLADQVHRNGQRIEAVYQPNLNRGLSDLAHGTIDIRGWGQTTQMVPISAPLKLLRFSPDGAALLAVEQVPSGGEQVYRITPDMRRAPVIAVPGHITRLSWRPDGSAVVMHSIQGDRLSLTLVRFTPTISAAAIADLPAANYAAALVPLTWDQSGLLWVAPDERGTSTLWRAPLTNLIPERASTMEARALTRLPDGALRVVTIQGEHVVIGRYQGDIFIGETIVPRVPATPDLMGIWQGDELLLHGGGRAWLLDVIEGN